MNSALSVQPGPRAGGSSAFPTVVESGGGGGVPLEWATGGDGASLYGTSRSEAAGGLFVVTDKIKESGKAENSFLPLLAEWGSISMTILAIFGFLSAKVFLITHDPQPI